MYSTAKEEKKVIALIAICDSLDYKQKEHLKIEDREIKKKRDDRNVPEKEQLRKFDKKGKKAMYDNLDDGQKEH